MQRGHARVHAIVRHLRAPCRRQAPGGLRIRRRLRDDILHENVSIRVHIRRAVARLVSNGAHRHGAIHRDRHGVNRARRFAGPRAIGRVADDRARRVARQRQRLRCGKEAAVHAELRVLHIAGKAARIRRAWRGRGEVAWLQRIAKQAERHAFVLLGIKCSTRAGFRDDGHAIRLHQSQIFAASIKAEIRVQRRAGHAQIFAGRKDHHVGAGGQIHRRERPLLQIRRIVREEKSLQQRDAAAGIVQLDPVRLAAVCVHDERAVIVGHELIDDRHAGNDHAHRRLAGNRAVPVCRRQRVGPCRRRRHHEARARHRSAVELQRCTVHYRPV